MSNDQNAPRSRDARPGYGQTAYKRRLAYQRLGIEAASVPCMPFFRASLKRIARLMNRPRPKGEADRGRHFGPFDCLQASADPDACKVSSVYRSVPVSYRRLLPPEAFCIAAGVDPFRALELIAGSAARQTGQASRNWMRSRVKPWPILLHIAWRLGCRSARLTAHSRC